jgi:G3E family GTPase
LTNDIAHTLRDLDERKRLGLIPAFHRVIIETTGLANPGPILQRLATDAWIARRFRVQSVIAVADMVNLAATLAISPEIALQIAVSDRVVLSKADLAEETALDSAIDLIRGLNPAVPIEPAVRGRIDPDILLRDTKRTSLLSNRDWDGHDHLSRLSTKSVQIDTPPLHWNRAAAVLDGIATRHGAALLRIKGILWIVESDLPVIIQAVQGVFQPPETLPGWDGHTPRSQIVLIGRDLDLSAIATSMRDALVDPIATSFRLEKA